MLRFNFFAFCIIVLMMITGCAPGNSRSRPLSIAEIQGCDHLSPYMDQSVNDVQGIVTKKYENGYVIQSISPDSKACSSEALFVYTKSFSNVVSGDLVSVSGKVREFSAGAPEEYNLSQTELEETSMKILSSGNPLPEAVLLGKNGYPFPTSVIENDRMKVFDQESDGLDYYESLEWMRVMLPESVVVGPRNNYDEIVLSEVLDDKSLKTNRAENALVGTNDNLHPERLMISLPDRWTRKVNVGDMLESGLVGIMNYSYGNYKIDPMNEIKLEKYVDQQKKEDNLKSSIMRIATYNINNFSQYSSKTKIRALANQIAGGLGTPDLLILEEVQDDSGTTDDGTVSAQTNLELLISEIRRAGGGEYQALDFPPQNNSTGGVPGGNIRTVFLLKSSSLLKLMDQKEMAEINSGYLFPQMTNTFEIGTGESSFNNVRKPVVGLFTYKNTPILVMGLHLVSESLNSPLYGSKQPIEQPELSKRIKEAEYINTWARNFVNQNPQALVIVAGDMNDGYESNVLKAAAGSVLTDCANDIEEMGRFSVIYDGLASMFDHIFISQTTSSYSCEVIHLNSLFDAESRVSDHDPVMISIGLN